LPHPTKPKPTTPDKNLTKIFNQLKKVLTPYAKEFDVTDNDNRHANLNDLKDNEWTFVHVDFTRNARRNDGKDTPFAAGHKVDDLFFFVQGDAELHLDEVTLYDAAR